MTQLIFGRYEKIKRLAKGGMGEVFLGRQTGIAGFDRLVILKSLKEDLAKEEGFVDQFLDEARVAATLNHPNIVSIYEVGQFEGVYYIAMEYINGEDLSKLWYAAAKKGVGLPFQVTVRIVHDAALGLDHAHHALDTGGHPLHVVHRDISPQNLMVRGDGVTKVVDFGIAKARNRLTRTNAGTVKGKLQYMSPEQVRGEELDGRADQFSLGVVLWEMCTGKRLFKAKSEIATLNKILTHPIPAPSSVVGSFPRELENTIMTMLERERENRFERCDDVAHALKGYLERAANKAGEVKVRDFVQEILGEQLKARTADLTPSVREAAAPSSPPRSTAGADRAPQGPLDDGINTETSAFQIRQADGNVVKLNDPLQIFEWIQEGNLGPDDELSEDEGKSWERLGERPDLKGYFAPPPTPHTDTDVPQHAEFDERMDTESTSVPQAPAASSTAPPGEATRMLESLENGSMTGAFSYGSEIERQAVDGPGRASAQVPEDPFAAPAVADVPVSSPAIPAVSGEEAPAHPEPVPIGAPPAVDVEPTPLVHRVPPSPPTQAEPPLSLGAPSSPAASSATWGMASMPPVNTDPSYQMPTATSGAPPGTAGHQLPPSLAQAQAVLSPQPGPHQMGAYASPVPDAFGATPATLEHGDDDDIERALRRTSPARWAAVLVVLLAIAGGALYAVDPGLVQGLLGAEDAAALALVEEALEQDEAAALERALGTLQAQGDAASRATAARVHTALGHLLRERARLHSQSDDSAAAGAARARADAHFDDAKRAVDAARQDDPRSADAHLAMAAWQAARGGEVEMKADLEAALRDAGDRGPRVRADAAAILARFRTTQALALDDKNAAKPGALAEAEKELERARAARGEAGATGPDMRLRYLAAAVLVARARLDAKAAGAAARAVDEVLAQRPTHARARLLRDAVGGDPDKDDDDSEDKSAKKRAPMSYGSLMGKAKRALQRGSSVRAARLYKQASDLKPGAAAPYTGQGWAYVDTGKSQRAISAFDEALKRSPNDPEAIFGLAEALRFAGRKSAALRKYERYLELAPSGPDANVAKNAIQALQ